MSDHLSVSQIKTFLRCPMQYEFSYMLGIKEPPAGVMIQGKAYHDAIAASLTYKRDSSNLLRNEDIIDLFSDSFEKQLKNKIINDNGENTEFEQVDWGEDTEGNAKDIGTKLAVMYHNDWVPKINPIIVEEYQTIDMNGVNFVLITDVVTDEKIIDHKLIKRRFDEETLKRDIQPTAYTYAHKKPFEFHQALKQKNLAIEIASTTRNENDWKFFEMLVDKVNKAIQSGIFYPSPDGYQCSFDYCGYYNRCRGKK